MKKILIVDDNQQNLYLLQVLLTANGFQVEIAQNGAEALECAHREPPYIIVSDILMPVMDGYALCRAWREDEQLKNIPFIFYSATYTEPKDQELALKLGADRFIIKPVEPDTFMALLMETEREFETGKLVSVKPSVENAVYYKEYNAALIRKLEDKMMQLEEANHALEIDIAERRQAENALRRSEEKWRLLVQTIPDYVAVLANDGRVEYINRSVAGYSETDVVGKLLSDFVTPESKALVLKKFEECQDSMKSVTFECTAVSTTGAMCNYDCCLIPMMQQNNVVNFMVISRDITERKQGEETKKKLEDQLRQAQKMEALGQLSSGVAHDFNNLLGGIMGHAELLKTGLDQDSPLHRHSDSIVSSCMKAAALTRQLLSFARKAPVELQKIDMNDFLKQVVELMDRTIDRSIEIVTKHSETSSFILGDRNQLENAFLNIAINARDAMPGGGRLSIIMETTILTQSSLPNEQFKVIEGQYVKISFVDTGTGMSREVRVRIFEPFFTTKELGKGTGLGLASVYGCVKQHHGYITVISQEGKGARFDLYFPVVTIAEPVVIVEEKNTLPRGQGTLLVVDDEPVYHEIISEIFGNLGYTVHCCSNGADAVDYYREHVSAVHVVILDINMPKMSGYQCFMHLKKINPGVRVVIASGYGDISERDALQKEGVHAFLQKPFKSAELRAKIAELSGA